MQIRPLTAADIPAGQRLREQAGWNQTTDDWRRLLTWDAAGCWVAEVAGQVVGTTTVTSYGQRIAWVGMVLVDEAHRRQGIGQALLGHALAYLEARGVQTVALDSTPAGQPLYHRLGFRDQLHLARWRGPFPVLGTPRVATEAESETDGPERARVSEASQESAPRRDGGRSNASPGDAAQERVRRSEDRPVQAVLGNATRRLPSGDEIRPLTSADLPAVAAYDARCFGTHRAHILAALLVGHPAGALLATRAGKVTGYAMSRPGARAWHLGPLAADTPELAHILATATLATAPLTTTRRTTAPAARPAPSHGAPGEDAAAPTSNMAAPDADAAAPGSNTVAQASGAATPALVMDALMPNAAAVHLAEALGLTLVRPFIRMTRGAPPPAVDTERLYTSAGPELG